MDIQPIAYFRSPFKSKFGIPRQSGLADDVVGEVVFVSPYDSPEAVRGIEGFDFVWLIWAFSESLPKTSGEAEQPKTQPLTVRPPRLGGNKRLGVFATRSPFRPNSLGLSAVRLLSAENGCLRVAGADLMDGTPIFDVKPYVPFADSHPDASAGFVDQNEWQTLDVDFPDHLQTRLTAQDVAAITAALQQDPRPQYHTDSSRIYGMPYADHDIRFKVEDGKAIVVEVR